MLTLLDKIYRCSNIYRLELYDIYMTVLLQNKDTDEMKRKSKLRRVQNWLGLILFRKTYK